MSFNTRHSQRERGAWAKAAVIRITYNPFNFITVFVIIAIFFYSQKAKLAKDVIIKELDHEHLSPIHRMFDNHLIGGGPTNRTPTDNENGGPEFPM